jgi:phosphatidylserine decarboxylase
MLNTIRNHLTPINESGYGIIIIVALATLICFMFFDKIAWLSLFTLLFCLYFFRDPERVTPEGNYVISPADGKVVAITTTKAPAELGLGDKEFTRVSIFLSVVDVHVNRIPVTGTVKKLYYHPGKFLNAELDKASKDNERQSVLIETEDKKHFALVQIAGLIARRIVCDLDEGQKVQAGVRYGIIKFGSRVDVYLPTDIRPKVLVGQTAIGGETIIADLTSSDVKEAKKLPASKKISTKELES